VLQFELLGQVGPQALVFLFQEFVNLSGEGDQFLGVLLVRG
jgi:hypothetical protein